jgi:hypothetical protein
MAIQAHLNQPYSSCKTYFEEHIDISIALKSRQSLPLVPPLAHHNSLNSHENSTHNSEDHYNSALDGMDLNMSDAAPVTSGPESLVERFEGAARVLEDGLGLMFMDKFRADVHAKKRAFNVYYLFASRKEWEFALQLLRSDLSMAFIDKFLKVELVRMIRSHCFFKSRLYV